MSSLKNEVLKKLENGFDEALENKIKNYNRETNYMPFLESIFSKKNTNIYSLGISLATWLGMSSGGGYEEISKILSVSAGNKAITQYKINKTLTKQTDAKIHEMWQSIKKNEIDSNPENILSELKSFVKGCDGVDSDRVVDVFITDKDNNITFIDITSPKSNMKESAALKLKLMRWQALGLAHYKAKKVRAVVALPYNPYHPKPYKRFSSIILVKDKDVLVQEKFWNHIAELEIYEDLLKIISKVGKKHMSKMNLLVDKISSTKNS